jgi:hypothetical protein
MGVEDEDTGKYVVLPSSVEWTLQVPKDVAVSEPPVVTEQPVADPPASRRYVALLPADPPLVVSVN